ncbi:KEOPS complex kinase/ATPase Bud32 [Candidatus Altiarchaeota archaeon]
MDLINKGAEANLYRDGDRLLKERVSKKYRIPFLDNRLRKARTKHEAKILEKLKDVGFPSPRLLEVRLDEKKLWMEYLEGDTLKKIFRELELEGCKKLGDEIGRMIALLHTNRIVHNDLTTSNLLLCDGRIYLIDFGLAFHTHRVEDQAMDLVVFRKSLYASHPSKADKIWEAIIKSYKENFKESKEIMKRTEQIEKRVRYA